MTTAEAQGTGTVHTAASLAASIGAELIGPPDTRIERIAALHDAEAGCITFVRSQMFAEGWTGCRASAVVVERGAPDLATDAATQSVLVVDGVDEAMSKLLLIFAKAKECREPGIHPTAIIEADVSLGEGVHVGAYCCIGRGTSIGPGTILHAGCKIAAGVTIGAGTVLHAGVVIEERCIIGSGCILHANVVIGADGFGYIPDPEIGLAKVPHIGIARIGDAVEIGAGSCVDRAKFGETTIGDGTKLDNMVQVAHNCTVGRCVIICALSGIGGSVTIGDGAQIGGMVGVKDGLTIAPGARLAAKSAVMRDVGSGETVFGVPAQNALSAMRQHATAKRLSELLKPLEAIVAERDGKK